MANEEPHHNSFWLGLVIGGLAGAVASYLAVADEKDKKKLIAKGKEILESLEDLGKEAAEKGKELKEVVVGLPQKVGVAVKEAQETAQEVTADIKKINSQAR